MKNTSYFLKQLLEDEMYLETVVQWSNQPAASVKQINRLTISLLSACLHQQLRTDIGKGLIQRILEKQAGQAGNSPDFSQIDTEEFKVFVSEGNRLLATILPGKKSPILRIIVHHARLSSTAVEPIVGLCAYTLFTKLAFSVLNHIDLATLLIPIHELEEFAPELSSKDYIAIGASSVLSPFKPIPVISFAS